MFNLICLDDATATPLADDNGVPIVFETGAAAATRARELSALSGKKYQPRQVVDESWRERENARFVDGTYQYLPWHWRSWYHNSKLFNSHFAHPSAEEPGKVAYTETPEKGARDIQTRITPGRYLKRFFGDHLTDEIIKEWSDKFSRLYDPTEVHFAKTEDDIEHVYTNGPRSCMSHEAGHFDSDMHPCRVYAAGDLAVAYITDPNDAERITARSLCWPDRKQYSRVYGDEVRLVAQLKRLGFTDSDLEGAKLLRRRQGEGFIVPYIDGLGSCDDDGKHLIIARHGDICCDHTGGLSEPIMRCGRCSDGMSEDDRNYVDDIEEDWCNSCYENHTYYCDRTGRAFAGEPVHMANGETWSQYAFDRYGCECAATGENIRHADAVELHDGTMWSRDHFVNHGFECSKCEGLFDLDDRCDCCEEEEEERPQIAGRDEHPDQVEMELA